MALILLQPGCEPLGQYDAADGYVTSCLGGEVCTFVTVTVGSDKAAADSADGYLNPGTSRAALSINLPAAAGGPWMLVDEGTTNYGTLFGTVVGGTDGQVATGGAVLGPHTATGSGKWTAWDKPGLYGVTLDALHSSVQPTQTILPGQVLCAQAGNQANPGFLGTTGNGGGTNYAMARFVEFRTKGALVTTPNRLVSALNSPSSTVGGVLANTMFMAVIHFQPGQ